MGRCSHSQELDAGLPKILKARGQVGRIIVRQVTPQDPA